MNFKTTVFLSFILPLFSGSIIFAQKTVFLDNWYNRETHAKTGKIFHYTWDDTANSGFSILGELFKDRGAQLVTLEEAPSKDNLKNASVYIIVDPDTTSENPKPNYVQPSDIKAVKKWVKQGGVLLLMSNDGPNAEFTNFNKLAMEFGFCFIPITLNPVINRDWEMGAETKLPVHPLFKGVKKIYLKEVAPIVLSKGAKPLVYDGDTDNIFIAETNYGKGYVLAIGDPWLYNEYTDHRYLPEDFDNDKAAINLVNFLLDKAK